VQTNPAKEVVNMCSFFKSVPQDDKLTVIQVLANNFLSKGFDPILVIQTFQNRVKDLRVLIEDMESEHVDEEVRRDAISALNKLLNFLSFRTLNHNYKSQLTKFVDDRCISDIRGVYSELNRLHPINLLSSEDIDGMLEQVSQEKIDLIMSENLPPFIKYSIVSGIQNLKVSLELYHVFGAGNILGAAYEVAKDIRVAEEECCSEEEEDRSEELWNGLGRLSDGIANIARLIKASNKAFENVKEISHVVDGIVDYLKS